MIARESPEVWRSAVVALSSWQPAQRDPTDRARQAQLREEYLAFLENHPEGVWRTCRDGHITASAIVVNDSGDRTLLTLHPLVGRWLQLGGHCEPADASLWAAARREAVEESGIAGVRLSSTPLRLDRHEVRCAGSTTWHLDVQYLARVPDDAQAAISVESNDLRWWSLTHPPADVDASVAALMRDAADVLAG